VTDDRQTHFCLHLACLAIAFGACASPGAGQTAYVGARVFDGTGRVIPDAVILEARGHIVSLGPRDSVRVPGGTLVVSLKGRWVIPGLIDGHAHASAWTLSRYLAYGVTSVRDVGGNLDALVAMRAQVAAGSIPGPRLYISGEALDGSPPVWPSHKELHSPAEAGPAVERLAAAGVSQIKLYTHTTRELMEAVVQQARARGIPVTAHLGRVDALTAARLGVHSIEHLSGVVEATVNDPAPYFTAHEQFPNGWMTFLRGWAALDSAALDGTAAALAQLGVVMVPTLIQSETYARVLDPTYANRLDLSGVPAAEQAAWNLPDLIRRYAIAPADLPLLATSRSKEDLFVRRFVSRGGQVVAGSDSPNQLLAPGASLHEELALLVHAGLSPSQSLIAATHAAAELLHADSIGVLRPGAVADFVVLSASPLDDIANVRRIELVVASGRRYTPAEIRRTEGWVRNR
jgi:imidazolonepropionase-like amidohydrolase